jgi:hypothetical protein
VRFDPPLATAELILLQMFVVALLPMQYCIAKFCATAPMTAGLHDDGVDWQVATNTAALVDPEPVTIAVPIVLNPAK